MSGLFGGVGCTKELVSQLHDACLAIWPDAKVHQPADGTLIGGSAYNNLAATYRLGEQDFYAVDGEAHLYSAPGENGQPLSHPIIESRDGARIRDGLVGNLAHLTTNGSCQVHCHESGTFPLYYLHRDGAVLFSSHVRPLARVCKSQLDHCGIAQFLGDGATFAGRTAYAGITRLLPGQQLNISPHGDVKLSETSQLWCGPIIENASDQDIGDEFWSLLTAELAQDVKLSQGVLTLMMSAGWDSRTLLAAYLENNFRPAAYFHGDRLSREHHIVASICSDNQIQLQTNDLAPSLLELGFLQRSFNENENVVFPHWHSAGELAAGSGPICAGILGEVPGGHYGRVQIGSQFGRAIALAAKILDIGNTDQPLTETTTNSVSEMLYWSNSMFYWYLNEDFRRECTDFQQATNTDIQTEVDRLVARGAVTAEQLVEGFVSEHRGAHYIAAQLLSSGHNRGLLMPFARSNLLRPMSKAPMHQKVHNKANKNALAVHSPSFNNYPSAATLVAVKNPLLVQEISRAARKLYELGRKKLNGLSNGAVPAARMEWVNFDFLEKQSHLMHSMVDDLQGDFWSVDELRDMVTRVGSGNWAESCHNVYDQLNKIYTIDLLLRDRN